VGGIDRTVAIASNFEPNADFGSVDVLFAQVPTTASYSVSYIGSDGSETNIIQGLSYSSLKDFSS
jgi:hypothetical protein